MKIKYIKFNSSDIFKPSIINTGFPALDMNMKLNYPKKKELTGFGIYAISLRHKDKKNKIIYIGKYQGEKVNIESGDPRDRWFKHIATATLLHQNLRWKSQNLLLNEVNRALKYFHNNYNFLKLTRSSIIGLTEQELIKKVYAEGKADMQISKNRMRLSVQNFNLFHKGRPNTETEIKEILKMFECHYWKVSFNIYQKKIEIKKQMKLIEDNIIDIYKNKLPMNDEYKINEKNFYHYNPDNLIDVDTCTFISFNNDILKLIKNFLI